MRFWKDRLSMFINPARIHCYGVHPSKEQSNLPVDSVPELKGWTSLLMFGYGPGLGSGYCDSQTCNTRPLCHDDSIKSFGVKSRLAIKIDRHQEWYCDFLDINSRLGRSCLSSKMAKDKANCWTYQYTFITHSYLFVYFYYTTKADIEFFFVSKQKCHNGNRQDSSQTVKYKPDHIGHRRRKNE